MAKYSVLVVDDDKSVYEQLNGMLDSEKYVLVYSDSVKEAKERIDSHNYDVIFLDLILPGSSGLDILEYLKMVVENKPKIILVTSYSAPEMEMMAIEMGAIACIFKPLEADKVLDVLHKYLEKKD